MTILFLVSSFGFELPQDFCCLDLPAVIEPDSKKGMAQAFPLSLWKGEQSGIGKQYWPTSRASERLPWNIKICLIGAHTSLSSPSKTPASIISAICTQYKKVQRRWMTCPKSQGWETTGLTFNLISLEPPSQPFLLGKNKI